MKKIEDNIFKITKGKRRLQRRGPTRFHGLIRFAKVINYSVSHVERVLSGKRENQEIINAYKIWRAQSMQEIKSHKKARQAKASCSPVPKTQQQQ